MQSRHSVPPPSPGLTSQGSGGSGSSAAVAGLGDVFMCKSVYLRLLMVELCWTDAADNAGPDYYDSAKHYCPTIITTTLL